LRVDAAEALRRDAQIALSGDLANAILDYRAAQTTARLAAELEHIEETAYRMEVAKRRAGTSSDAEALQAEARYQESQTLRRDAEADRVEVLQRLAILSGRSAPDVQALLGAAPSDALRLEASFPMTGTSGALRRRPDVVAAEAELAAAGADIRAAVVRRFPEFTLSSTQGWIAGSASNLGNASALASSVVPGLRWSIFDGGARRAEADLARSQEDEAKVLYEDVVNRALAETETFAAELNERRKSLSIVHRQVEVERQTVHLQRSRFDAGVADYRDVIDRSRSWVQARQAALAAERQASGAQVDLHAALGGDETSEPSSGKPDLIGRAL
jgi:outer membrane protein TolC